MGWNARGASVTAIVCGVVVAFCQVGAHAADRPLDPTFVGDAILSRPIKLANRDAILEHMKELGYPDADAYRIPLRETGGVTLLVRFKPKDNAQSQAESIALFRELVGEIQATGLTRVAFDASGSPKSAANDRFDYVFWRKPNADWILIPGTPHHYFDARVKAASNNEAAYSRTDRVFDRVMLSNFDTTRGAQGPAIVQLKAACADLEKGPDEVADIVQILVFAGMMQHAAALKDEPEFDRWVQRYAVLLGAQPRSLYAVPVYQAKPKVTDMRRAGFVEMEFEIDETGRVHDARILESAPTGLYDKAAKEAIEASRFLPQVEDGRTVPTTSRMRWKFDPSLKD